MVKIRRLFILFFTFFMCFQILSEKGYAATSSPVIIPNISKQKPIGQYTINADFLNVRKGPSTNYTSVGMLKKNQKINVYQIKNGWAYMTYGSMKGFVSSKYLKVIKKVSVSSISTNSTSKDLRLVIADILNVRKGPGTKYSSIGQIKKNNKVTVSKITNGWAYITFGSLKGYVSTGYLKTITSSSQKPSNLKPPAKQTASSSNKIDQRLVTADTLNIRKGPGTRYDISGRLKKNNKVTVLKITNGWAYITYGSLKGYVSTGYLKTITSTSQKSSNAKLPVEKTGNSNNQTGNSNSAPSSKLDQRYVAADSLNVRKGPGMSYTAIGSVKKNNKVTVSKITNGWAYITYGKLKGYVSAAYLQPMVPSNPSKTKIIVIDPGHGGRDPGAQGNGITEKELTLAVGLRVQKLLQSHGIKVIMTRTGDTYPTLDERNSIAAKSHADAFISIHANTASSSAASGTETYYNPVGDKQRADRSKLLAGLIQNRLYQAIDTTNRGIRQNDYRVITYNPLPAVLTELGFLSNLADAKKLKTDHYRDLAAQAIYSGILDFYKAIGK